MALIKSDGIATCAGVFTKNVVKGHSLQLCREYVEDGSARCVLINSGNANACIGEQGMYDAIAVCEMVSAAIGCEPREVLFGSTGVIGVPLPMENMAKGIHKSCREIIS